MQRRMERAKPECYQLQHNYHVFCVHFSIDVYILH
jgi:hypothetical protein